MSVEAIVTSPALSVIVTFEPATKSKFSERVPRVFPPAVIVLHVFVSVFVSVDAIVIVSVPAAVVSVTLEPATKVRVSAVVSATTLSCPLTEMVLNEYSLVSPLAADKAYLPSKSIV